MDKLRSIISCFVRFKTNYQLLNPQGKRHLGGNEQYDENMNVIVPAEKMHVFKNEKNN